MTAYPILIQTNIFSVGNLMNSWNISGLQKLVF